MRTTITRCHNCPKVRAAIDRLKPPGWHQRRRGRGCRFPRWAGDARYHQSLPLEISSYYTAYLDPPVDPGDYSYHPIVNRLKFIRLEADGRPRLRLLQED